MYFCYPPAILLENTAGQTHSWAFHHSHILGIIEFVSYRYKVSSPKGGSMYTHTNLMNYTVLNRELLEKPHNRSLARLLANRYWVPYDSLIMQCVGKTSPSQMHNFSAQPWMIMEQKNNYPKVLTCIYTYYRMYIYIHTYIQRYAYNFSKFELWKLFSLRKPGDFSRCPITKSYPCPQLLNMNKICIVFAENSRHNICNSNLAYNVFIYIL